MADTKQCPFGPCGRMLEVRWGTRIDNGQGVQIQKMPYHSCPPEADIYGDCPGSGVGFPITPREQMYLTKMEEMYVQRNANRQGVPSPVIEGEVVEETTIPDNVRPIKSPADPDNTWFRNSDMPIPQYGNQSGTGAQMTSVAELKAAIDNVHREVSEAMAAQAVVNQKLEDAMAALAATASTTNSDYAQGAMAALNQAKENGQTVIGNTLVVQENLSVWAAAM
jgi:hypothetical protein